MKFQSPVCVISASYGNDSVALIKVLGDYQRLGITEFEKVYVVYLDTGWAAPDWGNRVAEGESWASSLGFTPISVKSMGMEELVRSKSGFPANQYQFCTQHLKGVPFLSWIDEMDPECQAIVCVGKRRSESKARANTQEFVVGSEYHGGRVLWHPLYAYSEEERNRVLSETPFQVLPHRSQECSPCVNANRQDFKLLTSTQIARVRELEVEVGKPMFRPKRFGALGIDGVIAWALHGRKPENVEPGDLVHGSGCDGHYGCGL